MAKEIRNWIILLVIIICLTSPDPIALQLIEMHEEDEPYRSGAKILLTLTSLVYWGVVNSVLVTNIASFGLLKKLFPSVVFGLT